MPVTNATAADMLDAIWSPDGTARSLYLALHIAGASTSTSGNEVPDSNGYARVQVAQNEISITNNVLTITSQQDFPAVTSTGWGTPDVWALWTEGTHGGGSLVAYLAYSGSEITAGTNVRALANDITITVSVS